MMVITEHINY